MIDITELRPEDRAVIKEFGPLLSHDLDAIIALDERTRRLVEIADSRIHGKGYYALRDIAELELVFTAFGVLIGHQTEQHSMQQSMEVHMQTFEYGSKYLNHSCDGNLFVSSDKRGFAQFYARRPINAGEELTYYYPMSEFEWTTGSPENHIPCNCQSLQCGGVIRAFSTLNTAEQREFVEKGHISSYLANWFHQQSRKS